jgi:DNA-binding transcriptional LysR family regulator
VWELLANHEVDLAITGPPPAGVVPHGGDPAQHPRRRVRRQPHSPGVRRVSRDELRRATWLLREPGSGTRSTTEELFGELAISPQTLTLGSNGAIQESVRIGIGITLICRDAIAPQLGAGVLEEWRHRPLPLRRKWLVLAHDNEELAPTARLLLDHLKDGADLAEPFRSTVDAAPEAQGPGR